MKRSVLALLLLLTVAPLRSEEQPVSEWVLATYRGASYDAFRYGNYPAAADILQALRDSGAAPPALKLQLDAERALVAALRLDTNTALPLAESLAKTPDCPPESREMAEVAVLLLAEELDDQERLGASLQALGQSSSPVVRFAVKTLSFRRDTPEPTESQAAAAYQEAWSALQDYRRPAGPARISYEAALFFTASRIWNRRLLTLKLVTPSDSRQKEYEGLENRVFQVVEKANRTEFDMGYLEELLEDADCQMECHDLELASASLAEFRKEQLPLALSNAKQDEPQLHKAQHDADLLWRQRYAAQAKALGVQLADLKALNYSHSDGSLTLAQARCAGCEAQLLKLKTTGKPSPATVQRVLQLVGQSRSGQRKATRDGFLGMRDARFDQIAALLWASAPANYLSVALQSAQELEKAAEQSADRPCQVLAIGYQARSLESMKHPAAALEAYRRGAQLADRLYLGKDRYAYIYAGMQEMERLAGSTGAGLASAERNRQMLEGTAPPAQSALTVTPLAATRGEFNLTLARLRQENPRYAAALTLRPVNFSKQQRFIPPDAAIIQYFPTLETLYIFLVTDQDLKIYSVSAGEQKLMAEARAFREELAGSDWLYQALIAPVEKDVANKKVLAFAPTGELDYLPFAALGKPFLLRSKQCVTLLKAGDLDQLGQASAPARDRLLALGPGQGGAAGAAAVFGEKPGGGGMASLDGSPAGYLVLDAPLHLDPRNPSASYLEVGGEQLSLDGIGHLKLEGVRLVSLAQAAFAGGESTPGAGLSALVDAFAVAGSNSLLTTLRQPDPQVAQQFCQEFFTQVRAGRSLAAAQQAAQLKLAESHPVRDWAPFLLLGDWR